MFLPGLLELVSGSGVSPRSRLQAAPKATHSYGKALLQFFDRDVLVSLDDRTQDSKELTPCVSTD